MNKYAILGDPVCHSLSPQIHQAFAKQTGQTINYTALTANTTNFSEQLIKFQQQSGKGLNVTTPLKQAAYQCADQLSSAAKLSKAVNTLQCLDDGTLYGDNTDGTGLVRDLTINLKIPLTGKTIIVIGAGGAARGIMPSLLQTHPAKLIVANRTLTTATTLTKEFAVLGHLTSVALAQLATLDCDVLINATTVDLSQLFPMGLLQFKQTIFYDLNYGKLANKSLHHARHLGFKQVYNGLGMLVEQAAESFYLWHKVRPDTKAVRSIMCNSLYLI